MDEDTTGQCCSTEWFQSGCNWKQHIHHHGCGGIFYLFGFLGALYYYWTTATTFWAGFVGFFQALLWPVFLIYGIFKYLGL